MMKKIKKLLKSRAKKKTVKVRKGSSHQCSVCSKDFIHETPTTLVGMLGIIPVQFCRKCFPRVMAQSEELNLNDTQLRLV